MIDRQRPRLTIRRAMLLIAVVALFLAPLVMIYRQSQLARMAELRAMLAARHARAQVDEARLQAERALYAANARQARASSVPGKDDTGTSLDEKVAIEVAKRAVRDKETWADRASYTAVQTKDGWTVIALRIEDYTDEGEPLFTPGGFRTILIDQGGNVTEYLGGH